MAYNGLTNLGVEYLARMTAENKPVTFTKIKVGNGSIPASQTGASTTNLYSLKKEVEILSKNQIENSIKLQVLLNNLDLEVGFYVKELGIYVQDGEQEKLYWYINKDNPSYLPDKNTPSTHRYNLFLEVSNLETNIINFTGEGLLADKKFVEDSIEEAFNNFEEGYNATINTLLPKGNIPNSLNSAEKIVAALQGNGGLKFDENLLYLNDEGTKKKGLYYLDRLAEGIFECLEQTDEKVNNSAKFKNISNKENSDRLDNLSGDIGPFRKIELGNLSNGAESDDLPVGQYIVIGTHSGGFLEQNLIGVFTILSYYNVDRDKWIDVEPISSYMSDALSDNTYRLQFNPCRRRVRNTTANPKNYYAYYLGL